MKFLVMTDIEGVTGVTSFEQAENSDFGKRMLMNDLKAVLDGIAEEGAEAIVYDMHTDGRNVAIEEISCPAVLGKPIMGDNWRGVEGESIDGLFMVGLHTMQHVPGAIMAHSYLREYDEIYVNGILVGEIGMEAYLAGERGIPLKLVTGDDLGCTEAKETNADIQTCAVKKSLTEDSAICLPPKKTYAMIKEATRKAVNANIAPMMLEPPYEIKIKFSDCPYLNAMKDIHPEIFENRNTVVMKGDNLLKTWSQYLVYEKEMVNLCR